MKKAEQLICCPTPPRPALPCNTPGTISCNLPLERIYSRARVVYRTARLLMIQSIPNPSGKSTGDRMSTAWYQGMRAR